MQLRTSVKMLHVVCQEMRYMDSERPIYKQEIGGISYAYIHPEEPGLRACDILLQSTP